MIIPIKGGGLFIMGRGWGEVPENLFVTPPNHPELHSEMPEVWPNGLGFRV